MLSETVRGCVHYGVIFFVHPSGSRFYGLLTWLGLWETLLYVLIMNIRVYSGGIFYGRLCMLFGIGAIKWPMEASFNVFLLEQDLLTVSPVISFAIARHVAHRGGGEARWG